MRIAVPGNGPRDARIIIVGEQPGRTEMVQGRPFVGPAGRELDECLQQAGLARCDIYLTNVIKSLEKPLEYYCVKPDRRDPYWTPPGREYLEILRQELTSMSPYILIALGNVALFALSERWGITKWAGSLFPSTLCPGIKMISSIHPATIIPPKNVYTNKLLLIHDLTRARQQSLTPRLELIERHIRIRPSFLEVMDYLNHLTECSIVDCDIETDINNHQITCLSFADSPYTSMSIPFLSHEGNYWNPDQEIEIWKGIAVILESPTISKGGQNFIFDSHIFLRQLGIKVNGPIHDTMIAQKILMPDYPAGLDFITRLHTDIPYYKDEGKAWIKGKIGSSFGGWDRFYTYNGMDTIATAAARPMQLRDLTLQQNEETYNRKCRLIYPLLYMMEKGIRVDMGGIAREREATQVKIAEKEKELYDLAGRELKWNSPKALGAYLYDESGHHEYRKRNTKGVFARTTNDEALARLSRTGVKEAELIGELRWLNNKVLGTYLNESNFSSDGRIRCAYKPVGTATGRLSSAENIFDEGTNLQNWPHELLRYLLPDEGSIYYAFDLSQAENRIVAYVGRIHEMIAAFESGKDVHSLTGALISGKTYEEVVEEDEKGICAPMAGGKFTWRRWGKPCNHGLNYGMGKGRFSLLLGIDEKTAAWLISQYHRAYPGVQASYQALVRAMLAQGRTVVNLMGRHRWFLDRWGEDLFKEAYAQIPQSSVADKIDEHGLNFIYYSPDSDIQHVQLLNQIHDSIGFQLPISLGWEAHARILSKIKRSLETPYLWHDRTFIVPADLTIGLTMEKESGIDIKHKKWPSNQTALAQLLKSSYLKLKENSND